MTAISWRITRGRGSATTQLPLAVCVVLALVIALLGRAEASIFDNARAKLTDWASPALSEIRGPLATVEDWVGGFRDLFRIQDMNTQLARENAELRKWQNVAIALDRRLKRYEQLLNAVPDPTLPSTTARIIGQSNRPFVKTLVLNAGTKNGIKKGQAVYDDRGLIGRIFLAGKKASWVILLSDLNSRVPAIIQPSNRRAILSGDNGNSPLLELDMGDMPVHAGDRVVSSGDGGVVPPDLPIGVVVEEGGELRVALFANPDLSDFVQIIDYSAPRPPSERQVLLEPPPATVAVKPPAAAVAPRASAGPAPGAPLSPATPSIPETPAPSQAHIPADETVFATQAPPPVVEETIIPRRTASTPARVASTVGLQREER